MDIINQLVPLLTLLVLETILGIDNVIFISILAGKLPVAQRDRFRYWGLGLAMFMRLGRLTMPTAVMMESSEKTKSRISTWINKSRNEFLVVSGALASSPSSA